jgi:dihydroorotase
VRAVTAAPAAVIDRSGELGTLTPGATADVAILKIESESVELVDIHGARRPFDRTIRSVRTFVAGRELEPRALPPVLPWIRMVDSEVGGAERA